MMDVKKSVETNKWWGLKSVMMGTKMSKMSAPTRVDLIKLRKDIKLGNLSRKFQWHEAYFKFHQ